MKFADLLLLPRTATGRIDQQAARDALPDVPYDVLEQVIVDHGANDDFQRQYGHLELETIVWELRRIEASVLIAATVFNDFAPWFESVTRRTGRALTAGWRCIDTREAVVEHWREHLTWIRAPVFLQGGPDGSAATLHLVEGHTRLAVLRGLVDLQVVKPESAHEAWIGLPRRSSTSAG